MGRRARLVRLLVVLALVVSAVPFTGASVGAQEAQTNGSEGGAAPDVTFASTEELIEYIDVTEDYDGQFSPHIVPAAAFSADGANPDSLFFPFGGGYFQGDAENYGCMVAPVQLPDGSTVDNLFGYLYDNSGTFNFSLDLRRRRNDLTSGGQTMASVATSGSSASVAIVGDTSVANAVIDNDLYSYYLTTCVLDGNMRFHAAWIFTEPADNVFTVSGSDAQVFVDSFGPDASRDLFRIENAGPPKFTLKNKIQDVIWQFAIGNNGLFTINRQGTGGPEVQVGEDGSFAVGPGNIQNMVLDANGNLDIAGVLTTNGFPVDAAALAADNRALRDRVAELEARLDAMDVLLAELSGG